MDVKGVLRLAKRNKSLSLCQQASQQFVKTIETFPKSIFSAKLIKAKIKVTIQNSMKICKIWVYFVTCVNCLTLIWGQPPTNPTTLQPTPTLSKNWKFSSRIMFANKLFCWIGHEWRNEWIYSRFSRSFTAREFSSRDPTRV